MIGKKKRLKTPVLVVLLIAIIAGGVLFVGAVAGWFGDTAVMLDEEYECKDEQCDLVELVNVQELLDEKKSFVVFIDQNGCKTADRLREFVTDYVKEEKVSIYKMMFSEMKKTVLNDYIKYYPSIAIIERGEVKYFLRADADEDAEEYNNYEVFKKWMGEHLVLWKKQEN